MRNIIYLIGIGNKARHGKDTAANYIANLKNNDYVKIDHFAQYVKDEVINIERKYPLIHRIFEFDAFNYLYFILDKNNQYKIFHQTDVPKLHEIFEKRNINIYWGMEGDGYDDKKDGEMLQWWGTNYRRKYFGEDYWVNKVYNNIQKLLNITYEDKIDDLPKDVYFLIPDTRFNNEVDFIKSYRNIVNKNFIFIPIFLKVYRINEDGSLYLDPSRDPKHPSECDVDNRYADYVIEAESGDIEGLKKSIEIFLDKLETNKIEDNPFINF